MIIVIEGISAAGKTTWCRAHASDYLVPESYPADRKAQPETGAAVAQYWTDWNAKRWGDALEMEAERSLAVCDTDPLKLHFNWSLFRIGLQPRSQWILQRDASRAAVEAERLGFADAYFVKVIDPEVARRQRDGDTTRLRDRFDMHVQLQPTLVDWYEALGTVLPGHVHWGLPETGLPEMGVPREGLARNARRYDLGAFDRFIALLEQSVGGPV